MQDASQQHDQRRNRRAAFTLVEVLVTAALVAVAIVAGMGAIRAIGAADVKARDADLLMRLASEKLNDVRILQDPTSTGSSGDFGDRGYSDIQWTLDDEATTTANVDQLTVTVTRDKSSQALTTLVYLPSTTTSTTTSGSTSSQ